ncbi:unnamed protein product [Thlaspi arvense]|uniref:GOST seven transmembrane domain-containing protein n=1 Tax=Thlaspi arvense TaxID=13288 RepID=A0AAU9RCR0_THLAR|nr:unnamed protein product [Thlaspi arvense]
MANPSLRFGAVVLLLLLVSLINVAEAEIHVYGNKRFSKIANCLYVPGDTEALYASKSQNINAASSSGTHSKGMSFIRFDDITFVRTKEAANKPKSKLASAGLVETVVFEIKDREKIGGSLFKSDAMCCTAELANAGSCNLGEVIISRDPSEPEWPKRIPTFFEEHKEEVKMSPEALVINKTGLYTVYFMTCDPDLDGIVVRGRSIWKNLGGYLPGETAPLKKFYKFMFLAYVVLGLVWFPQVAQYWKDGIQLHSHISLVIAFYMAELVFLYFDFAYLDSAGTSPVEVTLWAVTISSVRKALSRLLLLVISSGYGIVKHTLGGVTLRMLLIGVMCFVISETLSLAMHFGNVSKNVLTYLMLSWSTLETCFLQWIFRSLWRTLKKLKLNKRNIAKLQLYRKFATVLVIMVVLNFAWIYVKLYVYESQSELWKVEWIIPAFWYLLAYALLVLICFFWPPSEKPTRYLHVAEMEEEFDEEDLSLAEARMITSDGVKIEDGNVERDERKSLLEGFILLFGNLPGER